MLHFVLLIQFFFSGFFRCFLADKLFCFGQFGTLSESWNHSKTHGLENFPWACRICPETVFSSKEAMRRHWFGVHPDVYHAQDVVHPSFGNHFSILTDTE